MMGNLFWGLNGVIPLIICCLCYFRVVIAIRGNSFRLQVAPLTSLRILEVRMNKLFCWADWVPFLLDPSYRVQLILTWLILDFLDKENWFSLFFSLSVYFHFETIAITPISFLL